MTGYRHVGVVGAGAWGTALAVVAARAGAVVTLWARRAALAAEIATTHVNAALLPGVTLAAAIDPTADPARVARADTLLLAVPAQHLRAVTAALAPHLPATTPLVLCAKGIERGTLRLMTEVAAETLPGRPLAVLSGPTFAAEVARGLPAAVTLAAGDQALAQRLIDTLGGPVFRPYLSTDPVGAQIGGAVKNVLAIACGIVVGRQLGDNARAALQTRGLAEILRLGAALGARRATLMGLSGLGDLTLTCTSTQSRNLSLGMALGAGQALAAILAGRRSVAEGVDSAAAVSDLARRHGVEMPIVAAVDRILNHGADIDAVINELLARPFRAEGR